MAPSCRPRRRSRRAGRWGRRRARGRSASSRAMPRRLTRAGRTWLLPALAAFPAAAHAADTVRPFFEPRLPDALRTPGPGGLLWWQWLAIPVALLLAWAIGAALGWMTRRLLNRVVEHTDTEWDDERLR